MKTVLITGCSSGYGLETALRFHAEGWQVIATMRNPRSDILPQSDRMRLVALDVTRPASIEAALEEAGRIDVLVNNAGIGLFGVLEATTMTKVREVFDTNTFAVMAMAKAVAPQMRARGCGVIVNVTSSAVLAPTPLVSIYAASKWAIEGFTECLSLELEAVGVRVKLVQPGYGPGTRFTANTDVNFAEVIPSAYQDFAVPILAGFAQPKSVTTAEHVAEAVLRAADDTSTRLRFPAGPDAMELAARR